MSRPRRRMGVSASFLVLVLTLFDLSGCGGLVAPTLDLGIQVGPNGAELSWIEHNGEKARVRYDVQRSTSEIGPWTSLIPDPLTRTDETRFIDATAPSNDGNFWYRVEADYRTSKKPYTPTLRYSQPLSVTLSPTCTTYCGPDPLPTLDALAQVANNTVDMDWSDTALPLAAPYSVERAPSASGPWTALVAPADRNSTMRFTDAQTPANDQTYFYRVVADHFRASAPANITLDPACTGYCVGYDLDRDGDGVLDWNDNCVAASNGLQSDDDLDGVGNACDAPANFDEALALDPDPVDQTALATEIQLLLDANADDPAKDHLLLYLTQGRYYVDNSGGPIVLSHNKPLYIYGAGREQVEIRGISNAHPIFQIENPTGSAQHVLLSGFVLMREDGDASTIESMVGVRSVNSDQMHIDLASMTFDKVSLEVKGAGFVRVQGTALTPRQWSEQAVLVDHPDADVFIINGGFGNGGDPPDDDLDPTQISNARQKRGRLRTYTAAAASARGQGDVWLETTSKYGAHVIADQRSEGGNAKGYECGDDDPFNPGEKLSFTSQFLYVPATTERVDVVVKGALASWHSVRVDANEPVRTAHCTAVSGAWTMAEYSSPGRLWMLGNTGYSGADHVVKGYAPGAHILTAGNVVRHPTHGPIDVTGTGSLVSIGDMGTFNRWCADLYSDGELNDPPCASPTGNPLYPSYRFMARDENGTLTFD
ncbi:MAG: hypothetical protein VX246_09155, partial [Myxococcota bacterium]|nr:hypothetical protein [Myxococcota bacterium]